MRIKKSKDYCLLNDLDVKIFPGDEPYAKINPNKHWWILYDEDEKAIGFCGLFILKNEKDTGFLCRSGVKMKYRGLGLQKKMIKHREKYAKKLGLKTLVTYVHKSNLASANNLIGCGFKLYNPEVIWGLPRSECFYFYKEL